MDEDFKILAKRIYKDVMEYSRVQGKPLNSMARDLNIPYTTFATWLYKLREGQLISLEGIRKIERAITKRFIYFD